MRHAVEVVGWVSKVGRIVAESTSNTVTLAAVEQTPIRCPNPAVAAEMIAAVEAARKDGNSLGGVITCAVRGVPAGWGEPVFDRLEADLAKAMLSLPATKGFEIGSALRDRPHRQGAQRRIFHGWRSRAHANQSQRWRAGRDLQRRDHLLRVAFKPTATIMSEQHTVTATTRTRRSRGAAATIRASFRGLW